MGNADMLEMEIENATISGLLDDLSNRFGKGFTDLIFDPKTKEVGSHNQILVNGRHYRYLANRLDAELKDGCEALIVMNLVNTRETV